jgi:hypothetical protein
VATARSKKQTMTAAQKRQALKNEIARQFQLRKTVEAQLSRERRGTKKLQEEAADERNAREHLEREVSKARGDLALRTQELRSAQARLTDLERTLRRIHDSPPYRLASRMWRTRARTRSLLRLGPGARGAGPELASDATEDSDEVIYAAGYTELDSGGPPDLGEPEALEESDPEPVDGADEPDPASIGAERVIQLLGGLTQEQLVRELSELDKKGLVDSGLLVITDCDALRTFDEYQCRAEYIPPRADWERLGRDSGEYDEFVRRRLLAIAGTHGLTTLRPGELITSR